MTLPDIRVGSGYDVHRIAEGGMLVLGGVEIPCGFGLDGHSDADVMIHALMDSLLGAAGLRDIGFYFPNTDEKYRGASSLSLLGEVAGLLSQKGFGVVNADITLIAEKPKIMHLADEMKKRIAEKLRVEPSRIGIKATTNEKIGFIGRGEGMAAICSCLIHKI